ncbi:minor capsid protein [Halobacillus sp. Cin3]|uniref:phage tail terminator protein n=1 Tax=Halobacillus sp. Cin3 TaxID=2928441 RepID=UPI00248EC846|nr:minor capsid protein [Halobacillus sp. Cin3]
MSVIFIESINNYLQNNVSLYAPIDVGLLTEPPEAIAIKLVPSRPGTKYFKGETQAVQFQFSTKSQNQMKALQTIDDIKNSLDNLRDTKLSGVYLSKCEVYTQPHHIDITSKYEYIYSAIFSAEYEEE